MGDSILHVVCYHQGCQVIFRNDLIGNFQNLRRCFGVKGCSMFIQQQQFGLFQGCHQECQCLSLTAGKQTNLRTQTGFQTQIQHFQQFHVFFSFFSGNAPFKRTFFPAAFGDRKVFFDLHIRCRTKHRVLEHTTQICRSFMFRQICDIHAINDDLTFIDGPCTGDGIQHSRFTSTVTADDGYEIPFFQHQINSVQCSFFIYGAGIECFIDSF